MRRFRLPAALMVVLTLAPARAGEARSPSLEPYRRLARAPEGERLLALARAALERSAGADSENAPDPHPDSTALAWPGAPLPVYVSLVRGRETRACVGIAAGGRGTLGETVEAMASAALRSDRRRPPVRAEELAELRVVISITDEGESISNPMLVDPGREGLSIRSPRGSVTFLPGEARTVRWALAEARRLGVLRVGAGDTDFRRLEVVTLTEPRLEPPLHSKEEP